MSAATGRGPDTDKNNPATEHGYAPAKSKPAATSKTMETQPGSMATHPTELDTKPQQQAQQQQQQQHQSYQQGPASNVQWSTFPGSVNVQAANGYSGQSMPSSAGYVASPMYSPYGQPMLDASTGALYRTDPSASAGGGYPSNQGYMSGLSTSPATYYGFPTMHPYAFFNYGAPAAAVAAAAAAAAASSHGPGQGYLMNRRNTWVPPSQYLQQQQQQGYLQPNLANVPTTGENKGSWRSTTGPTEADKPAAATGGGGSGGRPLKHQASASALTNTMNCPFTDPYTASLATQQTTALALAKVAQEAAAQQSAKYGSSISNTSSPMFPSSPGLPSFGHATAQDQLPPEVLMVLQNGPPVPPPVPSLFAAPNVEEALDSSLQNPNRTTNVYIRGLPPDTTDASLLEICERFGPISSSKAILDAATDTCKGFGFACFVHEYDAQTCISALTHVGYQVSFAKESFSVRLKNLQDPSSTNLYLSNLPLNMKEEDLEDLFEPYKIDSCRILRDVNGVSRGVGFARMDSRQGAEEIIAKFDGKSISGEGSSGLPLQVRFADSPSQKRLKGQTQRRRQWRAREYNILTGRAGFEEMSGYVFPGAAGAAAAGGSTTMATTGEGLAAYGTDGDAGGRQYGYETTGDAAAATTTTTGTVTGTSLHLQQDAEPRTLPDKDIERSAKAADQADLCAGVDGGGVKQSGGGGDAEEGKQEQGKGGGVCAGEIEGLAVGLQELSA